MLRGEFHRNFRASGLIFSYPELDLEESIAVMKVIEPP